jgi:hypothetical protein
MTTKLYVYRDGVYSTEDPLPGNTEVGSIGHREIKQLSTLYHNYLHIWMGVIFLKRKSGSSKAAITYLTIELIKKYQKLEGNLNCSLQNFSTRCPFVRNFLSNLHVSRIQSIIDGYPPTIQAVNNPKKSHIVIYSNGTITVEPR